jgi:hypothetical protein
MVIPQKLLSVIEIRKQAKNVCAHHPTLRDAISRTKLFLNKNPPCLQVVHSKIQMLLYSRSSSCHFPMYAYLEIFPQNITAGV